MDPEFIAILDSCQAMLREVLRTENPFTFPVSGTGTSGMECLLINFLEPGDRALIAVGGFFGDRLANSAERIGAETTRYEYPWGTSIEKERFFQLIEETKPKLVGLVNGETSTGVYQNMDGFAEVTHDNGGFLCVDCVTSLATCPIEIDRWGIDLAYSCSQKGLACPPGLAPVTLSTPALEVIATRKKPVPSFYFCLDELKKYLTGLSNRAYHHTAPVSMIFGLHQGLREVLDEGLEERWRRHREVAHYLISALRPLGLEPLVAEVDRLNALTTISIPKGVDDLSVRSLLLNEHGIEIGAGLGKFAGRVWRIGLMGQNSTRENVDRLVDALRVVL
jgi:alanine-glyoxylate transaminase/serine-glyoxylate transaminase/serine-pyruvate transaminase